MCVLKAHVFPVGYF